MRPRRITFSIIIICTVISIGVIVYHFSTQPTWSRDPGPHWITFNQDRNNRTLTVVEYFPTTSITTLYWDEVAITSGSAILPVGTIDVGDVLTNCSESGALGYSFQNTPTHVAVLPFGIWDFTE